ncbi:MAG: CDC48 family AAA ATPase [Candidatus Woesearchaeota archaeon]
MADKEITLRVAEAIQDDVNKGIVRIDSSFMHQIDVRPGDIVEIQGERKTVGIADRAYPGDIGLNIIRLDGLLRRNARTTIGESITVRKADVKEAKSITIAPARGGVMIRANPMIFKQGLLGRAVQKGDVVSLGGSRRRRNTMSSNPFFEASDIFNMLDENMMGFGLADLRFIIIKADPEGASIITENTDVQFNPEAQEVEDEAGSLPEVTYEDVGGLDEEVKKVREMVELPLKYPEIFERLGIEPPKGVLLHGPPGTGKTLLAKAVASETNSNFLVINGPEIMSKYYGQSEENLRKKFEEAEQNAPSIIFIDEIDAIATKREESKGEVERRVVAQLLAIMDGLKSRGKVVVIAATNIPNQLDPALRRPGRFDREIEIGVPGQQGRLNILKIHSRNMPLASYNTDLLADSIVGKAQQRHKHLLKVGDNPKEVGELEQALKQLETDTVRKQLRAVLGAYEEEFMTSGKRAVIAKIREVLGEEESVKQLIDSLSDSVLEEADDQTRTMSKEAMLEEIAQITHGFVGADLASLTRESAMIVLREILPDLNLKEEEPIPKEVLEKLKITKHDLLEALKTVRPSALREVLIQVPDVKWSDVGGLDTVQQELIEAVEWPLKRRETFTRMGIKPPKGVLLYGPPGTGKTLLAKAVASQSEANFILVKGPELLSKWVGESEKAVRQIFTKARQASPTIIFFDEIDSLAPRRGGSGENNVTERVVNQLLTEIDGLQELTDIVIIGATNRPDILDPALMRPGRFDRIVMVSSPDAAGREKIFEIHLRGVKLAEDVDIKKLVEQTEGYVGADIESVVREAAIHAIRENPEVEKVGMQYFLQALEKVRPSVTKEIEDAYKDLQKNFRKARAEELKNRPSYYG